MDVKLVVVGGDTSPSEIQLALPAVLGRGREVTVSLPQSLVSRKHCEVYESDDRLYVRDLGSLNGTFVGSERITVSELPPGELLTVGTVTFRAIYGEVAESWVGASEGNDQPATSKKTVVVQTDKTVSAAQTTQESPDLVVDAAEAEAVGEMEKTVDEGDEGTDIKRMSSSDDAQTSTPDDDDDDDALQAFLEGLQD